MEQHLIGKNEWKLGNESAKNVKTFGVDNSSSSHTDNCKNNLLMLSEGEEDTFGKYGSIGAPEKKLVLVLVEKRQNFD